MLNTNVTIPKHKAYGVAQISQSNKLSELKQSENKKNNTIEHKTFNICFTINLDFVFLSVKRAQQSVRYFIDLGRAVIIPAIAIPFKPPKKTKRNDTITNSKASAIFNL